MNFDWSNLLVQIPLVAAFMYFSMRLQEMNTANSEKQHIYWRTWLDEKEEQAKREREEWRAFIQGRDEQSRIERHELLANLKQMEMQLENLSNFTLLTYMHVTPNKDEILDNLKKYSNIKTDG